MAYKDKTLVCEDCGREFIFSAEDQEFYAQRGYQNEPKRCQECRSARKRQRSGESRNYPRQTFQAVCSACGKECDVPFQPRGDRPVYCQSCYTQMKTESGNRSR